MRGVPRDESLLWHRGQVKGYTLRSWTRLLARRFLFSLVGRGDVTVVL